MNLQDIWKDVFALARLAAQEGHPFTARNRKLQRAADIATSDCGDVMAGRKPGRIVLLQYQKRLPRSGFEYHPLSRLNCRCVVRTIHGFGHEV